MALSSEFLDQLYPSVNSTNDCTPENVLRAVKAVDRVLQNDLLYFRDCIAEFEDELYDLPEAKSILLLQLAALQKNEVFQAGTCS